MCGFSFFGMKNSTEINYARTRRSLFSCLESRRRLKNEMNLDLCNFLIFSISIFIVSTVVDGGVLEECSISSFYIHRFLFQINHLIRDFDSCCSLFPFQNHLQVNYLLIVIFIFHIVDE